MRNENDRKYIGNGGKFLLLPPDHKGAALGRRRGWAGSDGATCRVCSGS
jgi:hypothetical protein